MMNRRPNQKARLKSLLYPFQKRFIADESRFIYFVKTRQAGGSFVLAFKCTLESIAGQNNIFTSVNKMQAKQLIRYCRKAIEIIETVNQIKIPLVIDNVNEIEFKDGGILTSIANNPKTAVGLHGNLNIDEASRFPDDGGIKDAMWPFITRGYKIRMVSTPLGKRGFFWDYNQKSLQPGSIWSRHQVDVYQAIKEGAPLQIDDLKADMDEVSFRQNYMCEFVDDELAFFNYDLILSSIDTEMSDLSLPDILKLRQQNYMMIGGYDPGKIVDSGVFVILVKYPDGINRCVHIKEFKKVDYTDQMAYIENCIRVLNLPRLFMDATGVGEVLREQLERRCGSVIVPIVYTNTVKEQLVTDLKIEMENHRIKFYDHPKLVDQFHGITRKITTAGNTQYSHDQSGHDDIVLAIANAVSGFAKHNSYDITKIKSVGIGAGNGFI
jgi:phage FluMu gp28-like protein